MRASMRLGSPRKLSGGPNGGRHFRRFVRGFRTVRGLTREEEAGSKSGSGLKERMRVDDKHLVAALLYALEIVQPDPVSVQRRRLTSHPRQAIP